MRSTSIPFGNVICTTRDVAQLHALCRIGLVVGINTGPRVKMRGAMGDRVPGIIIPPTELFLREAAVRGGTDLMFFAYSRHFRHADEELTNRGLGRAHHRVLYFVARKPDMTVGELLTILGIAKQSLARVARELTDKGLLAQRPGLRDRRQRLLSLTSEGAALERSLFDSLRRNMADAFAKSGGPAVAGYWTVMQNLMGAETRELFRALHHKEALPTRIGLKATAGNDEASRIDAH